MLEGDFAKLRDWQDELTPLLGAKVHVSLYDDPDSDLVRQSYKVAACLCSPELDGPSHSQPSAARRHSPSLLLVNVRCGSFCDISAAFVEVRLQMSV